MTLPGTGPLDRDAQLGLLAEELRIAIAANEGIEAARWAERFSVSESDVLQLVIALRVMHESLEEDLDHQQDLAPPVLPADYEVGKELGRGGMGVVYIARQKSLNRDVAVKVLRPGDLQFGDAMQRFEREARSLARLRHRHIVSVHEVGKAGGFVYFTMDLILGRSLQQLIADGNITNSRAVKLLRQVASAMTYAHSQGVVHRDLKPANILVDTDDDAFVVDFGLARDLGDSREEVSAATMTGQLIGTPSYMSPEQALGDRERIGEAADIYALGAVLYECLTGKRPFQGLPLAKLMHAVIETDPVAPRKMNPRVPEDLEVICQKAMQKRIEDRYPTVLAMAEDLERFSIGREIVARRRSKAQRLMSFAGRNRKLMVMAVVPAALMLLLAWTLWLPGVMRDRDIAFGDQLLAKGNDEAALMAYRSAFEELTPDETGIAVRTRFAHCLINKAGRLQLRADAGFEADRDRCLSEARSLLLSFVQDARRGNVPLDQPGRLDALHEWNRLSAFKESEQGERSLTRLPMFEYQQRLHRDLNGPGRDAALVQIASDVTHRTSFHTPQDNLELVAVVELVRLMHRLPEFLRTGLRRQAGIFGISPSYRQPELEAGLINIVRDTRLAYEARETAGRLFHQLGVMPFAVYSVRKTEGSSSWHEPLFDQRDLETLVDNWDSLQGLDRTSAYRMRVKYVANALFRDRAKPAIEVAEVSGWDLRHWLAVHTSFQHGDRDAWQTWWQEHGAEDPRQWLLQALRWDVQPNSLTSDMVIQRFHGTSGQRAGTDKEYLHCLMTLTAPAGIRAPAFDLRGYNGDLLVQWERALSLVPNGEHYLRLATVASVNGSATPQVIWQKRVALRLDSQVRWHEWTSPSLDLDDLAIGFGRPIWLRHADGSWSHHGSAQLHWSKNGAQARVNHSSWLRRHGYSHNSSIQGGDEVQVGMVTAIGAHIGHSATGQHLTELINLAFLEPATEIGSSSAGDSAARDWSLEEWRKALGDTLVALAKPDSGADSKQVASCSLAASVLALPDYVDALRQVGDVVSFSTVWDQAHCRALLMAGDAAALTGASGAKDDRWDFPSYWLRVAQTADAPQIREHALAQARTAPLMPAVARTALRAHGSGWAAPGWLIERAEAAPSAMSSLLRTSWKALCALAVTILAMLVAAIGMWRKRGTPLGRQLGVLFWFATLVFANFTIWNNATQWNPPWIGFGLHVLASWYVCWRLVPGWGWAVVPLWWTVCVALHLVAQYEYEWMLWLIGVVLYERLVARNAALIGIAEKHAQEGYRSAPNP